MRSLARLKKDIAERLKGSRALEFKAVLGRADGTVKSRGENVYITLYNGDVLEVYNGRLPRVPYRKVWIGYDDENPTLLQVLRFEDVYDTRPHPNLPNHKESHTWFSYDPVELYTEQIMELLPRAAGGLTIRVYGGRYQCNGAYHIMPTMDLDLTAEAVADGAEWVNAEIDENRVVTYQHSANVLTRDLLIPEDIPDTSAAKKLLFSAKMYAGQAVFIQTVNDTDIFDPRLTGVASGGVSNSVEWIDVLNKPAEFPPDTDVTDLLYPRIFPFFAPPTVNDDGTAGYKIGDLWVDTVGGIAYTAIDVSTGAAVWFSGTNAGGGDLNIRIDGALAVATDVYTFLVTKDMTVDFWYIHCDDPGTASSTIFDVHKNGTTIFTTQGNRPTLAWNDADGWAKSGAPDVITFAEGDIITIDIDQIGTGAEGLNGVGQVSSSSGGGANPTFRDVSSAVSVSNVGEVVIPDGMLIDNGGGSVTLKNVELVLVRDEKTSGTNGGTFTSGAWRTRDLNTIVSDAGSHASLATNQITLDEGVYEYEIEATAFRCNSHQARLYNITDAAVVSVGSVAYADSGADGSSNSSKVFGRMVITASKAFEVQHQCSTTAADTGFGQPASFGTEVYTVARFWKVG